MVPDVQALKIAVEYQIVADRATQGSGAGRWKGVGGAVGGGM